MNARRIGTLVGVLAVCATPSLAQVVQVASPETLAPRAGEPAALSAPAISLAQAVELTILHDPQIRQSTATLRGAIGRSQETRGLFDYTLRTAPGLNFTLQELAPSAKKRESDTREKVRIIAEEFTSLTAVLRSVVQNTSTSPPRCPMGLSFDPGTVVTDRTDPTELALLGGSGTIRSPVTVNLGQDMAGVNLADICSAQVNTLISPEAFADLWRRIDQSGGLGLRGILTSVSQISREINAFKAQITEAIASRASLALDRLGPIPLDELDRNASFDVGLSKAFRNGMTLEGTFSAQSQEFQYVNKPLDPTFGGYGTPAQFRSSTSLTINVPLARGRGAVSMAAPERVSNLLLAGQREQLRHDVSEEVFRTVLSYLNLIAAQDTLKLLEESAARQQRLLGLSEQRVNSGDLARVELGRVQARAASVSTSAAEARAAVQSARVALAEAIGIDVNSMAGAPIATETFATVPAAAPPAIVPLDRALAARRDARAAEARRSAAATLTAGAEADRKPRLDFSWSAGFTNLYESPFFKFLPDEADPIINSNNAVPIPSLTGSSVPPLSPVRYFSPRGYARVLSGRYEPFFTVGVTIQLPFGNHAARGRALQARATLESRTIDAVDLRRVIGENIVSVGNSVQRTAAAVAAWQDAVTNGDRTLEGALQRFQTGDLTLIDTLLTEEGLTSDKLQLLRQRQTYFSAVARLKFEAGDLVLFDQEGLPSEVVRFVPATFVAR